MCVPDSDVPRPFSSTGCAWWLFWFAQSMLPGPLLMSVRGKLSALFAIRRSPGLIRHVPHPVRSVGLTTVVFFLSFFTPPLMCDFLFGWRPSPSSKALFAGDPLAAFLYCVMSRSPVWPSFCDAHLSHPNIAVL